MALFGRTAVVNLNDVEVKGLDIRFKIKKTDQPNTNGGEITIYNLNSVNRKMLESEETIETSLLVGYEDEGLEGQIFKGDMREAFSKLVTPDWVSTLRTGDGDQAVRRARVSKSYAPGTKVKTAWEDAVKGLEALGIGVGNAVELFKQGKFKEGIDVFASGGNLSGSAFVEVKRIAKNANLDVSIQDKELVVTVLGKPLGTGPVLLRPDSGLIGSPEKGAKGELKARALLIPGLDPKRTVEVQSRRVEGLFVIKQVEYTGDTAGNDWYADLECAEVK